MKFIRDIIAEKTNLVSASPETGSPEGVFATDEPETTGQSARTFSQEFSDIMAGTYEDSFDLLADPEDEAAPQDGPAAGPAAAAAEGHDDEGGSELFDNVWAEGETGDADADLFDGGAQSPPSTLESTDPGDDQEPVSNAEALMRTMYQSEPDFPDPPQTDDQPDAAAPALAPEPDETPPTTPFQRIMQRETTLPLDPATEPAPEPAEEAPASAAEPAEPDKPVILPTPEVGRSHKKAGRVKTRLLGFGNDFGPEPDMFAAPGSTEPAPQTRFPVGWMVVVGGPGRGTAFTLFNGVTQIGRGEGQGVRLDFGDTSISRSNHAAIAFDPEQQKFFLGHGGKANLVRLNGNPVLSTEPLMDGAEIRLGETTLRFVGLCGSAFDWGKDQEGETDDAQFA